MREFPLLLTPNWHVRWGPWVLGGEVAPCQKPSWRWAEGLGQSGRLTGNPAFCPTHPETPLGGGRDPWG